MSKLNLVDYASKGSRYIITAQEFDQLMNLIITSNNIHDDSVKFIGDLSTLLTADKTTLVNGINELYTWLNNLDKDSDGNFIVDDSEKLGGNDASYYTNSLNINFDDTIAKLGKINVQDALDKLKYLIDSLTTDDVRETYERVFVTPAQKVKLDSLPQASNIIQTDGSVPMDSYYSPENPQDIVTKRFLEEVANFTSGVDTSAFVSKAEFSGEMDKASYTKEIFNSNVNSPINAIRKAPQEVVKIEGQTLNNLLGDDGDCENVSDWESYQCLAVLDNTTKVFGSNSIKITLNPTFVASSLHKKNLLNLMPQGKYWFASACYKNGTASTGIRLVLNCDGDKTLSTPCVINDVWSRVGIKLHPTDYDISTYIYLENQLYGTEGEYAYVDGVALYEITQEEYDNLTVNELLEKYPYVNSMQSVINPIITYTGKNIAKLDDTTFRFMSPVSEITYTYVESGVRLERTIDQDEGAYIQFDIKAKCNTTYTMSGKFINHNPIGKSYIDINSTDFTGIQNFLVSTLSPTSGSSGSFSKTFTTFGNTNKLTISFYIQYPNDDLTSGKLDIEYYDIQIEENDIATVDESYIERQKQITGTFRGCVNVKDTIDHNYNLTKKMSDVINLWEHPTIQLNNTFTKTYKFEFTNFHSTYGLKNQGINSKNGVISGFVSPKTIDGGDYRQWYLGFTQLYLFAEKTVIDAQAGATTVDKFKTYLQAENIQGTFELATYTTTSATIVQSEDNMLLEDGSHIYQSGDNAVTPITTVKCATDVAGQVVLIAQAQKNTLVEDLTNRMNTAEADIEQIQNDLYNEAAAQVVYTELGNKATASVTDNIGKIPMVIEIKAPTPDETASSEFGNFYHGKDPKISVTGVQLFDGVLYNDSRYTNNWAPPATTVVGYKASSLINIIENETYCISINNTLTAMAAVKFWGRDNMLINTYTNVSTVTAPANAAYMTFEALDSVFTGAVMVNMGTEPKPYEGFILSEWQYLGNMYATIDGSVRDSINLYNGDYYLNSRVKVIRLDTLTPESTKLTNCYRIKYPMFFVNQGMDPANSVMADAYSNITYSAGADPIVDSYAIDNNDLYVWVTVTTIDSIFAGDLDAYMTLHKVEVLGARISIGQTLIPNESIKRVGNFNVSSYSLIFLEAGPGEYPNELKPIVTLAYALSYQSQINNIVDANNQQQAQINTNKDNITTLTSNLNTLSTDHTNYKQNNDSAVSALNTTVSSHTTSISNNTSAISTNTGNISTLQTSVNTTNTNVTNVTTRVSTIELDNKYLGEAYMQGSITGNTHNIDIPLDFVSGGTYGSEFEIDMVFYFNVSDVAQLTGNTIGIELTEGMLTYNPTKRLNYNGMCYDLRSSDVYTTSSAGTIPVQQKAAINLHTGMSVTYYGDFKKVVTLKIILSEARMRMTYQYGNTYVEEHYGRFYDTSHTYNGLLEPTMKRCLRLRFTTDTTHGGFTHPAWNIIRRRIVRNWYIG